MKKETWQDTLAREQRELEAGREAIRAERARVAAIILAGTEDDEPAPAEWAD